MINAYKWPFCGSLEPMSAQVMKKVTKDKIDFIQVLDQASKSKHRSPLKGLPCKLKSQFIVEGSIPSVRGVKVLNLPQIYLEPPSFRSRQAQVEATTTNLK